MSNFIETFKQGKSGKNFGLSTGIPALDKAINGIQRKATIGIASAPKVGKTTLADFSFLISPYLHAIKLGILDNVEWIYLSGEIDRVSKEFKIAAFFMAHDHNQYNYTYKGKTYMIDSEYLMGRKLYGEPDSEDVELIQVTPEHEEILKKVYAERIVPMFGEYDAKGIQITTGKITFIEHLENPTGINKYLLHHADENGKFHKVKYHIKEEGRMVEKEKIVSYEPNNPDKYTIVITDHIRKLPKERGFSMKENIDKYLEYTTILRNLTSYSFIHIAHSNRQVANVERLRFAGEFIFPTGDDVKDSGNLSEECTILLTMFNPNDEKYNLEKHFGIELKSFPNYRSIHVVEARNVECPQHIQVNMIGGVNMFTPLVSY